MDTDETPPPSVEVVSRRFDVLDALAGEEQQVRDLADGLDTSRSTVSRALRDLEETDFVERADEGGGYRATLTGRMALSMTSEYFEGMAEVAAMAEALEPLPPDAPLPPAAVTGGDVYLGTPPDPYRPNEVVVDLLGEATQWRSIHGMITDSRLLEVGYERVMAGELTAKPTIGPHVLELFREEVPDRTADLIASGRWEARITRDLPPFGLVLHDGGSDPELLVGIGRPSGGMHAVIRNDDPDALEWAEAFYTDIRERATPVEEYERDDTDAGT